LKKKKKKNECSSTFNNYVASSQCAAFEFPGNFPCFNGKALPNLQIQKLRTVQQQQMLFFCSCVHFLIKSVRKDSKVYTVTTRNNNKKKKKKKKETA